MTTTYDALPQLGVPLHHRDLDGVLGSIDAFVQTGRRTGRCHQIVTVNTDFIVHARKHDDVHAILRSADLAIPDGMPVVWASGALGQRLPSRIAGADLVVTLAERAVERGYRILFFGGTDDVGERAAELLRAAHPALQVKAITGMVADDASTEPALLDEIRSFRPDVICVALGHPKQERWIRRHGGSLGIPVGIGVGGSFDFIAGERKRAAPWIQRSGFEWLYRLAQEPGRLTGRYLTDITVYVPTVTLQILRTRVLAPVRRGGRRGDDRDGIRVVRADPESVLVELTRPGPLDHLTVAALTSLATRARRQGRVLRLVAPDRAAIRSLQKLRLDRLIPLTPAPVVADRTPPAHPPSERRTDLPVRP